MLRFRRGHDFSLKELISKALDKNGLTEVAAAIESYRRVPVSAANQESVDYAGRVLTEEVERQFGDEKRLTAELVLNAVDAKPPNYPGHFVVDIKYNELYNPSHNTFFVTDRGVGMELKDLISLLAVPFSTNKKSDDYIGRFGVGFLSSLQWAVDKGNHVSVTTSTGKRRDIFGRKKAWRAIFYGTDGTVRGVHCYIEPSKLRERGTVVEAVIQRGKTYGIHEYLKKTLEFFDPERAVLNLNGKPLNRKFHGKKIHVRYGSEAEGDMRVDFNFSDEKKHYLKLYSQGVLVSERAVNGADVYLELPPFVKLSQGRDEFVRDAAYTHVINGLLESLPEIIKPMGGDKIKIRKLRDNLPSVARGLNTSLRNKDVLRKQLGLEGLYTCDLDEAARIIDFLGVKAVDILYVAPDSVCYNEWEVSDKDSTAIGKILNASKEVELELSAGLKVKAKSVSLPDGWEGISPFLKLHDEIYYNPKNGIIKGSGLAARYARRVESLLSQGYDEKDIEGGPFI